MPKAPVTRQSRKKLESSVLETLLFKKLYLDPLFSETLNPYRALKEPLEYPYSIPLKEPLGSPNFSETPIQGSPR